MAPLTTESTRSTITPRRKKGTTESAKQAAVAAFGSPSTLQLEQLGSTTPPDQQGRRRLANTYLIERAMIVADPSQPRQVFDDRELQELIASISARGIKQPLTVRWNVELGKYMVIDGGRRFAAATALGLAELPCCVQTAEGKDILIDQIVHNWQRVNLRPLETADALARLRDEHGLSQQELAEVTGKPKSEISKLLAIHDNVTPEVQRRARGDSADATLTKRHLYNISKLPPQEQNVVADKVRNLQLTATETEELVSGTCDRSNRRSAGLQVRQRRFHTDLADVLITFNKAGATDADVQTVLDAIHEQLSCSPGESLD